MIANAEMIKNEEFINVKVVKSSVYLFFRKPHYLLWLQLYIITINTYHTKSLVVIGIEAYYVFKRVVLKNILGRFWVMMLSRKWTNQSHKIIFIFPFLSEFTQYFCGISRGAFGNKGWDYTRGTWAGNAAKGFDL
jgi:hypothetical protein